MSTNHSSDPLQSESSRPGPPIKRPSIITECSYELILAVAAILLISVVVLLMRLQG
jgi:hypothetical protein